MCHHQQQNCVPNPIQTAQMELIKFENKLTATARKRSITEITTDHLDPTAAINKRQCKRAMSGPAPIAAKKTPRGPAFIRRRCHCQN